METSYVHIFTETLKSRNKKQIEAINSIEGPVMVIAGPGTGKTDVLSLRIGQIIYTTDTSPSSILCLTYTDSGAAAMRKRLIKYIGPEAYKVAIHTFHSFCHEVIRENQPYFGGYAELQLASDIYRLRILKKVIDEFEIDNPLRRLTGDPYGEAGRLSNLFQSMKQEHWTSDFLLSQIEAYIQVAREDELYVYKRNGPTFRKGDFKEKEFDRKVIRPMRRLASGCKAFDRYEYFMKEHRYYDYADMLLWTTIAFAHHQELLLKYQEQFLYFLIDEFQDTNGTQLDIIDQLVGYWDKPNVFVVGDDDQSIYRFQGASKENVLRFRRKYEPIEIILDLNYRSSQGILNTSNELINQNIDRLKKTSTSDDHPLMAAGEYAADQRKIKIVEYPNEMQEEAAITEAIINIYKNKKNGKPNHVAVIYRNHKHATHIIRALKSADIPINVVKKINILNEPLIQNILTILNYIVGELEYPHESEGLLVDILHYRFFDISVEDIGMLLIYYRNHRKGKEVEGEYSQQALRDIISSEDRLSDAGINKPSAFLSFAEKMTYWLEHYHEFTAQVYFEEILNQSGILSWIIKSDNAIWNLQVINTFFDFIKNESINNPRVQLAEILDIINEMQDNRIEMPLNKITKSADGVHFMTAHGSKGLEFDRVFIIKAQSKIWDNITNSGFSFKYPENLVRVAADNTDQDERRLFYVAMTRCKYELTITHSAENKDGKPKIPSLFINEIENAIDTERIYGDLEESSLITYVSSIMQRIDRKVPIIDGRYIDHWLDNYALSVTGLNKYMRCPRAFYYEDILRVPGARNVYMGFGNAMHFALQRFFQSTPLGDIDSLHEWFEKGMGIFSSHFTEQENADRLVYGKTSLQAYFDTYSHTWAEDRTYKTEYAIHDAFIDQAPITGKIDRIDIFLTHIDVFDYKTGSYANASKKLYPPGEKSEEGGDYWRQLVFYKILLQADPKSHWTMHDGVIDFVQPDTYGKMKQVRVQIQQKDIDLVKSQIINVYQKMKNHQFEIGCDEEDCHWCNLINQHID